MKFSCEKALLQAVLGTASRAVASKSSIPALEGLLLQATPAGLTVSGYNMQTGIRAKVSAEVTEPGEIVLNARLFGDIVRRMPDDVVTFSADEKRVVHLSCGDADFDILGLSAADYPELPVVEDDFSVAIQQRTLRAMIEETAFAVSTNESRPVHTGALFEIADSGLTMVAVDGYRMALRREAVETCDAESLKFIVPGAALSDLEKICMSPEEPVKIAVGSKHVSFSVGDTVLISRRLEGEFLNFRKTVPGEFPIQLKAQRADLLRCTDRVSLIIDDRTKNPLRCVFGENMLTITCATPLGRAEDCCPLEGDGGGMIIGFNNSYLMDAFKAAPADTLRINIVNGSAPCIITPEDGGDSFLYMILPVRLRSEG